MRMLITMLVVLIAGACAGDSVDGTRTCAGNLYDACADEHECMSGNCHNFATEAFQVCSTTCTPGDDTPCSTTSGGKQATCSAIAGTTLGICTPAAPNDCTRAP